MEITIGIIVGLVALWLWLELAEWLCRRNREVSTGALTIFMALLILGIGMIIGYGWRAYVTTPRTLAVVQPSGAEKRWIEQRHKYHGL